jgi:DNA-binding CsgD family transcriptional regulator
MDGLWRDAHDAADLGSFRKSLIERLESVIGADTAVAIPTPAFMGGTEVVQEAVTVGFDPVLFDRYLRNRFRYYSSMRPLMTAVAANGGLALPNEVYDKADRQRLDFFVELHIPARTTSGLCVSLAFRGLSTAALSLNRHGRTAEFTRRELESMRRLLPLASVVDAAVVGRCTADSNAGRRTQALSPRERQVAALVRLGLRNKEIAAALGTSVDTVRKQTRRVYEKLGVAGRMGLATELRNAPSPAMTNEQPLDHRVTAEPFGHSPERTRVEI